MSLSRRAFVGYAGATVALTALGGVGKLAANDETLLRPPGSQDIDHFFATCIKCDRCRSICPEGIIETSTLFEGILSARTPKLNFHRHRPDDQKTKMRGYCTFCDKCMQVCPTGAVRPFDEKVEKIGVAIIQPKRCLAYTTGGRV